MYKIANDPMINVCFEDIVTFYKEFRSMWQYFMGDYGELGYVPAVIRKNLVENLHPLFKRNLENDGETFDFKAGEGFKLSIHNSSPHLTYANNLRNNPVVMDIYIYLTDDKADDFSQLTIGSIVVGDPIKNFIVVPKDLFLLRKELNEEEKESMCEFFCALFEAMLKPICDQGSVDTAMCLGVLIGKLFLRANVINEYYTKNLLYGGEKSDNIVKFLVDYIWTRIPDNLPIGTQDKDEIIANFTVLLLEESDAICICNEGYTGDDEEEDNEDTD